MLGRLRRSVAPHSKKLAIGAAGVATAAAIAFPMLSSGGSVDVFVGSTPTPVATPTATATPAACDFTATTSTFTSQVSAAVSATGNQKVCLAAGDYGEWMGANKTNGVLTVTHGSGVATSAVHLAVDFTVDLGSAINNITVDGVTVDHTFGAGSIAGVDIDKHATNITLSNDVFPAYNHIEPDGMSANNILITGGDFTLADCPTDPQSCNAGAHEGRLTIYAAAIATNAGITVRDSQFHGNCADGVHIGGANAGGVTIGPGNEFHHLLQGSCGPHVDPVQFIGASGDTITGNYFHDDDTGVMNYDDGATTVTITGNGFVNVSGDGGAVILMGGDRGSTIQHNTIIGTGVQISLSSDPGNNAQNTIIKDNITPSGVDLTGGSGGGTATPAVNDYQMCAVTCVGAHSLSNKTLGTNYTLAGGSTPTSLAGFALATGSGIGAASDGTNIGVNP